MWFVELCVWLLFKMNRVCLWLGGRCGFMIWSFGVCLFLVGLGYLVWVFGRLVCRLVEGVGFMCFVWVVLLF